MTSTTPAVRPEGRPAAHRAGRALAAATLLLLVWSLAALGVIGDGGPEDRIYLAVLAVALGGTALARLRPRGMALTCLATAAAHVVVAGVALLAGWQHTDGASVTDILAVNAMFAVLFAGAAALFARASGAARS